TAAYLASGQRREAGAVILWGLALNVAASSLGAAILWLGAEPIARIALGTPEIAPLLRILAAALPAQTTAWAAGFILIGLGRPALAQLLMNALTPVLVLAAMALGVRTAAGVLWCYAAVYFACLAASLILIALRWRVTAKAASAPSR